MNQSIQHWFRRIMARLSAIPRLLHPGHGARRRRQQIQTIRNSALFDERWYLDTYPDVATAGVDPVAHFSEVGWREGRDPSPDFATSAYLKSNHDVAGVGLNPLLHFIEFGQSEGREVRGSRILPRVAMLGGERFPEAAPVFAGKIPRERAIRWRRWYRLDAKDARLLTVGEWRVGYVRNSNERSRFDAAFEQLRRLSGYAPDLPVELNQLANHVSAELIDAWFVNEAQLCTRWLDSDLPVVVRGYQHDQFSDGALRLVTDALVKSPLEFVEVSVNDPFFPILFVFAEPDGTIRGMRLLAFPSLCRGGLHYSELVCVSEAGDRPPDPLSTGVAQTARLAAATVDAQRLVKSISVDLAGADGTSPLFRQDFRTWLERVARVSVRPLKGSGGPAAGLLGDGPSGDEGATLILAADMIPTIGVLTEVTDNGGGGESFLPMLLAGPDPSQPATLVEVPPNAPKVIGATAIGYRAPWPRVASVYSSQEFSSTGGPAGIRLTDGRQPSDSELLVPAMGPALPFSRGEKATVTWLVVAGEWDSAELIESVRALSLNSDVSGHLIGFIGEPEDVARSAAATLFRGRVRTYGDLGAAARQVKTDFIGYLGSGVILHDSRSSGFLLSLLDDPTVASASCPLVTAEKRGKSWHVSIVDPGSIPGPEPKRSLATQCAHAQQLWRSFYPAAQPPRDLWLARTSSIKKWFGSKRASRLDDDDGMHVCTTLISAAYSKQRRDSRAAITLPRAPEDRAIRTRALYG